MKSVQEYYSELRDINPGSLSGDQKKEMYRFLQTTKPEELRTVEDHQHFIEILQKLRMATADDMKLMGKNFLNMIQSVLSVGEDGLYSNHTRFFYELVQNVDDCDYENIEDCNLDIAFRFEKDPAQMIFTYNEKGFTPENVFSITGIAEKSKNVSSDKSEIGEKGIGFKSVFGIADKVRIQSGMFSFDLYKDNFTIPYPVYQKFEPVKGTKLILEMSGSKCRGIYDELVREYMKRDTLLNKNPILFLNKLTHLRMYFDDAFRYMEFNVQRRTPEPVGELSREQDIKVSVSLADHRNGTDFTLNKEAACIRYSMPITYGKKECASRYGDQVAFDERHHNLIMIFPVSMTEKGENTEYTERGIMYSFLPTQVHLSVPILIHAPFKLDSSREFVDPQQENAWFQFTIDRLSYFLRQAYIDAAHILRENIIRYIPTKNTYLFVRDNEKINCLQLESLRGITFCEEKIFCTVDESFECASDTVTFDKEENLTREQMLSAYEILKPPYKLFIPSVPVNMGAYGCRVISSTVSRLFKAGLQDKNIFEPALQWLRISGKKVDYESLINECKAIKLYSRQVAILAQHPYRRPANAFVEQAYAAINKRELPKAEVGEDVAELEIEKGNMLQELLDGVTLAPACEAYLKKLDGLFLTVQTSQDDFMLPCKNGIVVAYGNELNSFAKFVEPYDKGHTFTASLRIRQASDKLNLIDDQEMSNDEYLKLLHAVRISLMKAYGQRMYENYIQIIHKAGADKSRFLNELIQNADDCDYPEGVIPSFSLTQSPDDVLISGYNETGFSKQNVRAITAIGESTKSVLLGHTQQIGEKGVGFKSVFGVASSVDIHSNGFHFTLTDAKPTVPMPCEHKPDEGEHRGTVMLFHMKTGLSEQFTDKRILQLCLCLRKLRSLNIFGHSISIEDTDNVRTIQMDGITYRYQRTEYSFTVSDEKALQERRTGTRILDPNQKIVCYIPEKELAQKFYLYAGLPIANIQSIVPVIIDAPFELTTSRDEILKNKWNEAIRENLYKALIQLIAKHVDDGMDALKFVGFRSREGIIKLGNFSDANENSFELNSTSWRENLQNMRILPILGRDAKTAAGSGQCTIIPDFIARLNDKTDITDYFHGTVIDTIGKAQFVPLLEYLGCKKAGDEAIYNCLSAVVNDNIRDDDFRKGLYQYLSNNQGNVIFPGIGRKVFSLNIFPTRTSEGLQYTKFDNTLYFSKEYPTKAGFKILDTSIMGTDIAQAILSQVNTRLPELTSDVIRIHYQDNIVKILEGSASDASKVAFLQKEYRNSYQSLARCQYTLTGMKDKIPLLMADGSYKTGAKFINTKDDDFEGSLIRRLIVDDSCKDLAKFLRLGSIRDIHYSDIDFEIDEITDDDVEDLDVLNNYAEIARSLRLNGLLSEDQIDYYNLGYADTTPSGNDEIQSEEFPDQPIKDQYRLRNHIHSEWDNKNPYEERTYTVWRPHTQISEQKEYVLSTYRSRNNPRYCFCQMCGKITSAHYIEVRSIEREPVYAWPQMNLCLCLNCSKDYVVLRSNNTIWNRFIRDMMDADPRYQHTIKIGDQQKITFTATHLAEVQELLKLENYPDHPMQRKKSGNEETLEEESVDKILKRIENKSGHAKATGYPNKDDMQLAEKVSFTVTKSNPPSGINLYLKSGECNASGIYSAGMLTVLKGSKISSVTSISCPVHIRQIRVENRPVIDRNHIVQRDFVFASPLSAAQFVTGYSANGYEIWNDRNGVSLNTLLKQYRV